MSRDASKIIAARAIRGAAYGLFAVLIGTYLDLAGWSPTEIGVLFALTLIGAAAATLLCALVADRIGRRRTLAILGLVMTAAALAFAITTERSVLLLAALTGTLSISSSDVGAFQSIEQAIVPQTVPARRATFAFALYNLFGDMAAAAGSLAPLAGSAVVVLGNVAAGSAALFLGCAAAGIGNVAIAVSLSPRVESGSRPARHMIGIHRSRSAVAKLSALFSLDAFGDGFVIQAVIAYWFHLRWQLTSAELGIVFFAANLLSAFSLLAAPYVASRVGLLNTMVFTHGPSNLLLMVMPLAPSADAAIGLFFARMALSQMDVPTGQSYVMSLVEPDERTATAGITSLARTLASAVSPALAGVAFSTAALGAPLIIGGAVKVLYDGALFTSFRGMSPARAELGRSGISEDHN